jgi:uncharacterized protein YndB with AHSA1/START domain
MTKPIFIALPGKQEAVTMHVFDAPRDLVFKCFTDPALIPRWWGPRRLTTVVDTMIVKVGGVWRFVQRDSAGQQFAFHGVFLSVAPPDRLVYSFEYEGMPGHISLETVSLEEQGVRTRVTEQAVFQCVEDRDEMVRSGMESGAVETMERLGELLEKEKLKKQR